MQATMKRVLCVAEDEMECDQILSPLGRDKYQLTVVATAAEALSMAAQEKFDLYLFDTLLSDGDGVDLCFRVREFDRETPILLLTDAGEPLDWQRLKEAGAQGYLVKAGLKDNSTDLIKQLFAQADGTPDA